LSWGRPLGTKRRRRLYYEALQVNILAYFSSPLHLFPSKNEALQVIAPTETSDALAI
jgi:hypothetical protein